MANIPETKSTVNNEMSASKRTQEKWTSYIEKKAPRLHIYNSLTRSKVKFEPINGNIVKFYICGPTVYDAAHMGHARAYLSFDIVRRVLNKYFDYKVYYAMNVTDIDDKIIKRARQNYLYDQYVNNSKTDKSRFQTVVNDVIVALEFFKKKSDAEVDPERQKMLEEMTTKLRETIIHIETELASQVKSLANGTENSSESMTVLVNEKSDELLLRAKDVLADWLDSEKGHSVNELSVFSNLAKHFEKDFLNDMDNLNVLPPSILTRVSAYIPEIIEYVQRIIQNGYAYETKNGSVYFDTAAFDANPNHHYAKLVPEAYVDSAAAAKHLKESEGELSIGDDTLQEKRSTADFALWKCSKSGEPFWNSPWGNGRPGWHIECSAMSTAIFGEHLDIHAGGFDLKFPHHDNEIAQCEAYFNANNWTNYFLHCGTLRIEGSKMSKSLKNFISIKEALKQYTARQLRILFLMHTWTDLLDYSTSSMERVLQFEKFCNEFFCIVKDIDRKYLSGCVDELDVYRKFTSREMQLVEDFNRIQFEIHEALCDSIDTRTVMEKIREIVKLGNIYIMEKEKKKELANNELLKDIATYIVDLFKIFGAIPENYSQLNFPREQSENSNDVQEEQLMPVLDVLAKFREDIRNVAKANKYLDILNLCDVLRDDLLPELGVRLEDRDNQSYIRLDDRTTLLKEREQRKKLIEDKAQEKLKKQKELEENKLAKQMKQKLKLEKEAKKLAEKQNKASSAGVESIVDIQKVSS